MLCIHVKIFGADSALSLQVDDEQAWVGGILESFDVLVVHEAHQGWVEGKVDVRLGGILSTQVARLLQLSLDEFGSALW